MLHAKVAASDIQHIKAELGDFVFKMVPLGSWDLASLMRKDQEKSWTYGCFLQNYHLVIVVY